ncbi:MAG: ATP-dependent zinc metalloprotease FtsH [Desulfobulbaceae bacterium]|nr:ATP-dependent zinc metalloprotease FtsH [Desulfobulbaceae bacterium]
MPQWLIKQVFLSPEEQAFQHACEIPYSTFKTLLRQGGVQMVVIQDGQLESFLHDYQQIDCNGRQHPSKHVKTRLPQIGDPDLLPVLERKEVTIKVEERRQYGDWFAVLVILAPMVFLFALFFWYWLRQRGGRGFENLGDMGTFVRHGDKETKIPDVTFEDVVGQASVKLEVTELVDFLRNPEKFMRLGAEVPRGVLLVGPPGTGKTLMARALAGEAGVPFYTVSGSEFVEVFVGVGASRVREFFATAKKHAPSIIFIDELDSVGGMRGAGIVGGHDEREQTLNQILAEMDGFSSHEAVIVLAATNRPDVLDPALLRPGRFDRHVTMDLPEWQERLDILCIHTKKVPLADDVDLNRIAAGTPGFSGADLKNLVNEAAILAVRKKCNTVVMDHFDEARDKLLLGTVRTMAILPEERHRLAVHEAGHALVSYFLPNTDPLYKVSIIPRGHSLGGTEQIPIKERHTFPQEYLEDRLVVMLGGRSAEKEILGSYSSGAEDDIRQASALARSMVSCWGMSPEIGPVDLRMTEKHPYLGREVSLQQHFSDHSAQSVDQAVARMLQEAEQKAIELIRQHRKALDNLVELLKVQEILDREEITACLKAIPVGT